MIIKTNLFLGVDKMIEVAHRTGIQADLDEVASLPLGTSEINLLDFATGYTTFATGGYQKELYFIEKIEDLNGNVLYEHKDEKKLVLNPNYTYILNEIMNTTSNDAFVDYTTPTALTISSQFTNKYAIKTGSTNTDFWIVGYNKDALVMTWMGYDDNQIITSKVRTNSKKAWVKTIEYALKDIDTSWYETPKNVVAIPLDAITGQISTDSNKVALYYYVKGTEPYISNEQYVSSN